jgi:DNA-binding transcriptional ArsR family regulator
LSKVFDALASDARRKILAYLSRDGMSAGEIAARFEMSKPAISKHLQILENAGLVTSEKRGQFVWYAIAHETLNDAIMNFLQTVAPRDEPVGPAPPPPVRKPRARDDHAQR